MLPNRPSPRNGAGFPTAARSRSVAQSRQDEPSDSYSREPSSRSNGTPSSRQVRSQRSMASMPPAQDRSDSPPSQPRQTARSNKSSRTYESPSKNRKESDASSSTTMSSTTSSFLDRLKGGGDTSSRTSLEEDYESPKRQRGQVSKPESQDAHSYEGISGSFVIPEPISHPCFTPHRRKPRRFCIYHWRWLYSVGSFGCRGRHFRCGCRQGMGY
jgi:hypothetical protein